MSHLLLKSNPVKTVATESNVYKSQYSKFYSEIHKKIVVWITVSIIEIKIKKYCFFASLGTVQC